jgi:hypothetical protein
MRFARTGWKAAWRELLAITVVNGSSCACDMLTRLSNQAFELGTSWTLHRSPTTAVAASDITAPSGLPAAGSRTRA